MEEVTPILRSLAVAVPPRELLSGEAARLPLGGPAPAGADTYRRLVERSRVETRRIAYPPDEILRLGGATQRAPLYERSALDLGERAAREAIAASGLDPRAIRLVVSASCTGYVLPSFDAHLVDRLGLDPGVRRVPITELGCSAGVASLALAAEMLVARGGAALVVCVEPCSLCVQADDPTPADLVGNALFGDAGAAAIVDADGSRSAAPGPSLLRSASHTWPEHAGLLGMRLTDTGPRLVLSPRLPEVLRGAVPPVVDAFLARCGLDRASIAFWGVHPGGPRILEALGAGLGLDDAALAPVWNAWRRHGNVSSATVFLILREIAAQALPPGAPGLLLAVGPGLSLELLLVRNGGWLAGA